MKKNILFGILFATVLFSCSKTEKLIVANETLSLKSSNGIALAENLEELKGQIAKHLGIFEKDLKVNLTDITVSKIVYFKPSKGVSAKVSFDVQGISRTIVIGRGDLPKFTGNMRGFQEQSTTAMRMLDEGTCVSYSANCAGQTCCDVEGTMGTDGKMTFRCLCAGCTLNVTTKTTVCPE